MKIPIASPQVVIQRLPGARKANPPSPEPSLERVTLSGEGSPRLERFSRKNPSLIRIGSTVAGAQAGGLVGHFLGGPTGAAIGATVGAMICNEISRGSLDRTSRAHVSKLDDRLFPVAERLNSVVALAGAIGIVATATLVTLGAS